MSKANRPTQPCEYLSQATFPIARFPIRLRPHLPPATASLLPRHVPERELRCDTSGFFANAALSEPALASAQRKTGSPNTSHWGRLFGDRYKAVLTEGRDGYYYSTLLDYIHLNPARVGLVRIDLGDSVGDYPWSSVGQGYALPASKRPEWLAASEGFVAAQCSDTAGGRRSFVERLDKCAREEGGRRAGLIEPANDRRRSHLRHRTRKGVKESFPPQVRNAGLSCGNFEGAAWIRTARNG